MKKKNLAQELRELATNIKTPNNCAAALSGRCCNDFKTCAGCVAYAATYLADRIEAEYDPKPEPDTVEKVAKDMDATLRDIAYLVTHFKGKNIDVIVEEYRKRLDALGVTFDD